MSNKKVIPEIKVKDMPFFDEDIPKSEKQKYGMICSTGIVNGYRVAFAKGQGASRKDKTFNKEIHEHTCCGSKVPWRHKISCLMLGEGTLPPDN